ncbi:hypothetical protein QVM62_06810 [Pseudomonas putida]|uniref:hypothetical protein n=1 Tax=Pseudomonas TaxID=286 RepID=UPI0035258210
MKYLDTTAGSTHATNVAVLTYMPPEGATTVLAYLDRLQALEAAQPDPAHARKCRTDALEALILKALDSATLSAALADMEPCYRVSAVIKHLNYYKEDHGDVKKRYDIDKAPCRKKVREILMKHNFM